MITQFPRFYPDELFHSLIARYHARSGNLIQTQSLEELFGNRNFHKRSDVECPMYLGHVHSHVSHFRVGSVEEWIGKHTMYRYYTNTTDDDVRKRVYDKMVNGYEDGITAFASAGGGRSWIRPPHFFRYCSACVAEDYHMYGETYWRMTHQLPSVFYCTQHHEPLRNSSVPYRSYSDNPYVRATRSVCHGEPVIPPLSAKEEAILFHLSCESEKLAKADNHFDDAQLRKVYDALLRRQGYLTPQGKIRSTLYRDFTSFYGENILNLLQAKCSPQTWAQIYPLRANHMVTSHSASVASSFFRCFMGGCAYL
ncbi:TniQ family protein [Bacillus sp. S14(2024)]|uniref:TniQ family protein n=1 Tax=Bacillus sp. S14(2024) TaxID=3162884 RepID=UPI003D1A27A3